MDVKQVMIESANLGMKKNKEFEDKYGANLDFALNFDKCIYFAKSKNFDKPQYGGKCICVARYYRPTSQLMWEHSNTRTSKLMKQKASFVKDLYHKNREMTWFGVPGINKIPFDMAHCIVASAFSLYRGLYLATVEVKEMVHFIILEDIDAVKEQVSQAR